MQITFWGVRGSFPTPGTHTLIYGGNTPCVELIAGDSRIIVDAGTGIYDLGLKNSGPAHYHLVFSHTHWDHIQGLSYFTPLQHPESRLTIYTPVRCAPILRDFLTGKGRRIYLPASSDHIPARIHFETFQPGESWHIGNIKIATVELNHPGYSVGFRFSAAEKSVVYFSDTAPFSDILFGSQYLGRAPQPGEMPNPAEKEQLERMRHAAISLSRNANLLIHDAHFTTDEYPKFAHFGHSTPDHAWKMAKAAQVQKLVLFHHAPERRDDQLAKIESQFQQIATGTGIELAAAREGNRIDL